MNVAELTQAMIQAKAKMDAAEVEHRDCVIESVEADKACRIAEGSAYLVAQGTVPEREARVKKECATERYRVRLAEGLERSALEAIRNARQYLSALQSLAAAQREEARLAAYMDREGVEV